VTSAVKTSNHNSFV